MLVRAASPGDEHRIVELIIELAVFEKEPHAVKNNPEKLRKDLFEKKLCEAFVGEVDGMIQGYAIYYTSYSTWNGPCLYLEDIYVSEAHRQSGLGSLLFDTVKNEAVTRNVPRMDWQILAWNELALEFYERKGATIDKDWVNGRLFFDLE